MLMSAVNHAVERCEHLQVINRVRRGVVHIQSQAGTGYDIFLSTPTIPQRAHDEAADILDTVLLGLGHLPVLLNSLRRAPGGADPFAELLQRQRDPIPSAFHSAVAYADCDLHVRTS